MVGSVGEWESWRRSRLQTKLGTMFPRPRSVLAKSEAPPFRTQCPHHKLSWYHAVTSTLTEQSNSPVSAQSSIKNHVVERESVGAESCGDRRNVTVSPSYLRASKLPNANSDHVPIQSFRPSTFPWHSNLHQNDELEEEKYYNLGQYYIPVYKVGGGKHATVSYCSTIHKHLQQAQGSISPPRRVQGLHTHLGVIPSYIASKPPVEYCCSTLNWGVLPCPHVNPTTLGCTLS